MDSVLAEIGGYAGIGGILDFLMSKGQKEKLKDSLTDWWVRFEDLKWMKFGRAEAETFLIAFDHLAGRALWTTQRWRCVLIVTAISYAAAVLWTALRFFLINSTGAIDLGKGLAYLIDQGSDWLTPRSWVAILTIIVAFAVSLSLTRAIAALVARISTNALIGMVAFSALLVAQVVLFVFWSNLVVDAFVRSINVLASELTSGAFSLSGYFDYLHRTVRLSSWGYGLLQSLDMLTTLRPPPQISVENVVVGSFKALMDLTANGLRIVFALAFLGSFVFRPLIQAPISWVWARIVESDKPIFTLVFGIIGALHGILSAYLTPQFAI